MKRRVVKKRAAVLRRRLAIAARRGRLRVVKIEYGTWVAESGNAAALFPTRIHVTEINDADPE